MVPPHSELKRTGSRTLTCSAGKVPRILFLQFLSDLAEFCEYEGGGGGGGTVKKRKKKKVECDASEPSWRKISLVKKKKYDQEVGLQ